MSEAKKKQHYVPKVYLKKFSVTEKKPYRVYSLRRAKGEISLANIEDVAEERYFYTIKGSEDPFIVENTYAETADQLLAEILTLLDSRCNNVLIQNDSVILDDKLRADLALSMTYQLLRGKQFRRFEEDAYVRNIPAILDRAKIKFPQISPEKWDDIGKRFSEDKVYSKALAIEYALDPKRIIQYASIFYNRTFIVYLIKGEIEFITSDNPVMAINSVSYDPTPFRNGLLEIPTTVYYPVSPKILVASYHPAACFGNYKANDGKLKFLDENSDSRFIRTLNRKQYEQCFGQVYSKNRHSLEELINT